MPLLAKRKPRRQAPLGPRTCRACRPSKEPQPQTNSACEQSRCATHPQPAPRRNQIAAVGQGHSTRPAQGDKNNNQSSKSNANPTHRLHPTQIQPKSPTRRGEAKVNRLHPRHPATSQNLPPKSPSLCPHHNIDSRNLLHIRKGDRVHTFGITPRRGSASSLEQSPQGR